MKKIIALFSIILIGFVACEKSPNLPVETDNVINYEDFGDALYSDLNQILKNIESSNFNIITEKTVYQSAKEFYGSNSDDFIFFNSSFQDNSSINSVLNKGKSPSYIDELLYQIEVGLTSSTSSKEFVFTIDKLIKEVLTSNMEINKKNSELLYLSCLKATVNVLENNHNLLSHKVDMQKQEVDQEDDEKWWERWGRCAAAIAGGALTGAGTGILGGAAVGTVALPIVGTVSGAALGGIILGIGGGLTGAAAGC